MAARKQAAVDADFRAAIRHSRRVRFLKRALPIGVLIALAAAIAIAYLDPLRLAVNLPFELGTVTLEGSRIKMELPKLSGFTNDNRGYDISAKYASQDVSRPNEIDLEEIRAQLELAENGWAHLTAQTGHYDTKTEKMSLGGGIRFDTSSGYGGTLKHAEIDMKAGTMTSREPVELNYLDGKLTADTLEVSQKDSRALLTGHVHMVFRMPPPSGDAAKDGEAGKPEDAGAAQPQDGAAARPQAGSPPAPRTATPTATPAPETDGITGSIGVPLPLRRPVP